MKVGAYEITPIISGSFALDGGAMFGVVPKSIWNRSNPADELNRIPLLTRNLLMVSESKKILVDTGLGSKWNEKLQQIYKIDNLHLSIINTLKNENIHPEEITDVIISHLHFDHTGGSTTFSDGKLIPTFPNAAYHIQSNNLRWAFEQNDRDKASYLLENFEPLLQAGVIKAYADQDTNFSDEIQLLRINGHTFGMQLVKISDGTTTLLYCADLIPTASHIPLPFIMGYDLQPLITLEEKKEILSTAVDEDWILIFEHDPHHHGAKIQKSAKGYEVKCFIDEF